MGYAPGKHVSLCIADLTDIGKFRNLLDLNHSKEWEPTDEIPVAWFIIIFYYHSNEWEPTACSVAWILIPCLYQHFSYRC